MKVDVFIESEGKKYVLVPGKCDKCAFCDSGAESCPSPSFSSDAYDSICDVFKQSLMWKEVK